MYSNPFDGVSTGLQIKDWIWHHIHEQTSYTSLAKTMYSLFNLDNEKCYKLTLNNNIPVVEEVSEKGSL